jgi:hypothetical protein
MRKRYRVLILAALAAALAVPVGYAWTTETTATARNARYSAVIAAPAAPNVARPEADAAKLLGIGTLLFGLAAVVRKTI